MARIFGSMTLTSALILALLLAVGIVLLTVYLVDELLDTWPKVLHPVVDTRYLLPQYTKPASWTHRPVYVIKVRA